MWKRIATIILLVLLGAAAVIFWPESAQLDELADAGIAYDVQILRDDWGVPHVFGMTDADVWIHIDARFIRTTMTDDTDHAGQKVLGYGAGSVKV